jgi:quercetin dioxygenase-like cupin family protein
MDIFHQETTMSSGVIPHAHAGVLGPSEGNAYWFLGTLVTIKARGADTNGAFSLIEQLAPPGFGPPLHVHQVEDESFYVLEGEATFYCGEQEIPAGPGTYVSLPKGIPHTFLVGATGPARLLQLTLPAGFDRFVEELGEPATTRTLPPMSPPPVDRLLALAPKYHFSVLGPPPGTPPESAPSNA